ncbi:hypothetical protein QBC41DRAFT_8324 [Cercophora samala]|uniref:Uncharacterized protein n=1 Tax=Cercophora samala TaxID=330535 RepID=A0AA40D7B1_9PEZI|nr:hypothetical protein QBC41DRAFT_8324 [Cercophora samala]
MVPLEQHYPGQDRVESLTLPRPHVSSGCDNDTMSDDGFCCARCDAHTRCSFWTRIPYATQKAKRAAAYKDQWELMASEYRARVAGLFSQRPDSRDLREFVLLFFFFFFFLQSWWKQVKRNKRNLDGLPSACSSDFVSCVTSMISRIYLRCSGLKCPALVSKSSGKTLGTGLGSSGLSVRVIQIGCRLLTLGKEYLVDCGIGRCSRI